MLKLNDKGFAISGILYSILILFLLLLVGILGVLGSRKVVLDKTKMDVFNDLNEDQFVTDAYNVNFVFNITGTSNSSTGIISGEQLNSNKSSVNKKATFIVKAVDSDGALLSEVICDNGATVTYNPSYSANEVTIEVDNITADTSCSANVNVSNFDVCFTANTLIKTPNGMKKIQNIEVDDKVYSFDFASNRVEKDKVDYISKNEADKLYQLTIGNDILTVTEAHPFYVKNKGWIKVKDLLVNDEIKNYNGFYLPIRDIKILYFEHPVVVYNLTVKNNSNYFVGENLSLVHNKSVNSGVAGLTVQ